MTAYLMTNASRTSKATPDAGIRVEKADDGTVKYRRDQSEVLYAVRVLHEWITAAEFAAILALIGTNGYGPFTFTLHGLDYSGTLTNEPAALERKGDLYNVESLFVATKV